MYFSFIIINIFNYCYSRYSCDKFKYTERLTMSNDCLWTDITVVGICSGAVIHAKLQ